MNDVPAGEEGKMKRAVITGATGAIGTALIRELIENQVEVLVLFREGSARKDRIPVHPLVKASACSLDGYDSFAQTGDFAYDVFYHLAWNGTTGPQRNDWYLQNQNVKYALDAVALASRLGCRRFIGIGSQAEYGRVDGILGPDTPACPETGYGIAKLAAGLMTREYARQLGMVHHWVRVLSVYGPGDGSQSLVMTAIREFMEGSGAKFTKGEQDWDYLNSADAARALYRMGWRGVDGRTYVLGGGKSAKLRDYIEVIRQEVNPEAFALYGAVPYSDRQVMHLEADISDLRADLGWEPAIGFREGIRALLREMPV